MSDDAFGFLPAPVPRPRLVDADEVRRALSALASSAPDAFELRVLGPNEEWTVSGLFDAVEPAVAELEKLAAERGTWFGAYFIPNPINPNAEGLHVARGRLAPGSATKDEHITRRRWLLLDVDAIRPKVHDGLAGDRMVKASATDAEKAEALAVRDRIVGDLAGQGWPWPIRCDSGNGAHALWRVNLPAGVREDPWGSSSTSYVPRLLAELARRYDTPAATIDKGVGNASRIWKLPGTLACKGPNLPDRPWRMARLEDVPAEHRRGEVTEAQILALLPPLEVPTPRPVSLSAGTGVYADIQQAREEYKRRRSSPGWPRSRGTCPACKHNGCFNAHPEAPDERWICHSDNHGTDAPGCGRQTTAGKYSGDVIDLDRFSEPGGPLDEVAFLKLKGVLSDRPRDVFSQSVFSQLRAPAPTPAPEPVMTPAPAPTQAVEASTPAPAPAPQPLTLEQRHLILAQGLLGTPKQFDHFDPTRPPMRPPMLLTRQREDGEYIERDEHGRELAGAGFLPLGIVGMLAGEGGGGKSQASVQLAVAIATGGRWFDTYDVAPEAQRGRVLLAMAEDEQSEIQRRVWHTLQALQVQRRAGVAELDQAAGGSGRSAFGGMVFEGGDRVRENVRTWPLSGVNCGFIMPLDAPRKDATSDDQFKADPFIAFEMQLEAMAAADGVPWSLIVLDPATRFLGADSETDNKAATEWIRLAQKLTKLPGPLPGVGPTVLVVHHTTKTARREGVNDATAARGSSALTDGCRWVAHLGKVRDTVGDVGLTLAKANYVRSNLDVLELVRETSNGAGFLRPITEAERAERLAEAKKEADEKAVEAEARKKYATEAGKARAELRLKAEKEEREKNPGGKVFVVGKGSPPPPVPAPGGKASSLAPSPAPQPVPNGGAKKGGGDAFGL